MDEENCEMLLLLNKVLPYGQNERVWKGEEVVVVW